MSPIRRQLELEGVFLFCMLLGAFALAILTASALSQWLAAPIVAMSGTLNLIAAGDLSVKAGINRSDELGEAGRTIDAMVNSLQQRATLTKFVPPQVLKAVAGGDLDLMKTGREVEVTVLATDIRSFTTLSEMHPPGEVFGALNRHFQLMTEVIQAHGGVVDRFVGDAILAGFYPGRRGSGRSEVGQGSGVGWGIAGSGGAVEEPSVRAVAAARAMQNSHASHMRQRSAAGAFTFDIGIGLEGGPVVTGILGDEGIRLDFTILGEPLARAVELEALSKLGRATRIILSEKVARAQGGKVPLIPLAGSSPSPQLAGEVGGGGLHGVFEVAFQDFGLEDSVNLAAPAAPASPAAIATPAAPAAPASPAAIAMPAAHIPPSQPFRPSQQETSVFPRQTSAAGAASLEPTSKSGGRNIAQAPSSSQTQAPSQAQTQTQPPPESAEKCLPTWLLALLVAIPIFLAVGGLLRLEAGLDNLRQSRAQQKLEQDFQLLERLQEPEAQISLFLRRAFLRILEKVRDVPDFEKVMNAEVSVFFSKFRKSAPTVNWGLAFYPPPLLSGEIAIASLTGQWRVTTVGHSLSPSRVTSSAGVFLVEDSSTGFSEWGDNFQLLFRPLRSDLDVSCRILRQTDLNLYSVAGLMVRDGLNPGSPMVFGGLSPQSGFISFNRENPDVAPTPQFNSPLAATPGFIRLSFHENRVDLFYSENGANWMLMKTAPFVMTASSVVGLGATSWINPYYMDGRDTRLSAWGGSSPLRLSLLDLKFLLSCGKLYLLDFIFDKPSVSWSMASWTNELFPAVLSPGVEIKFSICPSLGSLTWLPLAGAAQHLFSFLLFQSWKDGKTPPPVPPASWSLDPIGFELSTWQAAERLQKDLLGMIALTILPQDISLENGFSFMLEEFARGGTHLAVISQDPEISASSLKKLIDPVFKQDPELAPILASTAGTDSRQGSWVVREGRWERDSSLRIVAARRIESSSVSADGARFLLPICILAFYLLFLGFRGRGIFACPLRVQLIAALLTAAIPVLPLGIILLELLKVEAEMKQERLGRQRLEAAMERVQAAIPLFRSWVFALLTRESDRSEFQNAIKSHRILPQKSPPDVMPALIGFFGRIYERGFPARNLTLIGPGRDFGQFPYRSKGKIGDFMIEGFSSSCETIYPLLSAQGKETFDRKREGKNLVLAFNIEEIYRLALNNLGPEKCSNLLLGPTFLGDWVLGAGHNFTFRRTIWSGGKPRLEFLCNFDQPIFEHHLFCSLEGAKDSFQEPDLALGVVEAPNPMFRLLPPYYSYKFDRIATASCFFPWAEIQPGGLMDLTRCSQADNAPLFAEIGEGPDKQLVLCQPNETLNRWTIFGYFPIGRILAETDSWFGRQRLLLLAFLILALLLAFLIAREFLRPCARLLYDLDQVMKGNYQVCLPADWGAEWGTLACSFNQMAGEVQEGRLLGRFVSESTIEAARSRLPGMGSLNAQTQAQAQAQEVVILFAGLPDFKKLAKDTEPIRLVENLNLYLRAMSAIIHHQGGEIDKFIGDKILAVFRPKSGSTLATAVGPALTAAKSMARGMKKSVDPLPRSIGIGITAGTVLSGILGTDRVRLEHTVIGDTVNLASRLADLACRSQPGGILVGDEIVAMSADSFADGKPTEFTRIDVSVVKGKTRNVNIFQLQNS